MHLIRMVVEIRQNLLERHQKMALLKDARAHKAGYKSLIARALPCPGAASLPCRRVAAVRNKLRSMHVIAPPCYILYHLVLFGHMRHRARRVSRPLDHSTPAVRYGGARHPALVQVLAYRIAKHHLESLILQELPFRLSVRLQ